MRRFFTAVLATVLAFWTLAVPGDTRGWCQQPDDRGGFQLLPELGGLGLGQGVGGDEVTVSAKVYASGTTARLDVTATMKEGWHVYSLTQAAGGPTRTTIQIQPSDQFRLVSGFAPDNPPKVKTVEVFDVPIEEHSHSVTWSAGLELAPGVDPTTSQVKGTVGGLVCSDTGGCIPVEAEFVASYAGALKASSSPPREPVRPPDTHAVVSGVVQPTATNPGGSVQVRLTVVPDQGWHVYGYEATKISEFANPTLIHVAAPSGWQTSDAVSSVTPKAEPSPIPGEPDVLQHEQAVTWTVTVQVPQGAKPGTYPLQGAIGLQTCQNACDFPTALNFETSVIIGDESNPAEVPLQFASVPGDYESVTKLVAARPEQNPADQPGTSSAAFDPDNLQVDRKEHSLAYILPIALLGGFILNFMPCVLPVIGLKIVSFVDQAGKNRGRVFALNVWYSLGMLSIFWVLATLASAASLGLSSRSLGWGEQFNYDGFNIPLLSVVFVMGLSFLGVWELPIPGFATGGKASELAAQEGAMGAFCKGVITTILATPCSGPGLAAALAWSAGKPPILVYLVFTLIGLGMAFPYLLIGAFPSLIRYLPKPGAWMETFKQLMGFVLLGTVVYLMTLIEWVHLVPTVALLFGLWAACWWIGSTSLAAEFDKRVRAWAVAAGITLLVGTVAFANKVDLGGKTYYGLRGMMQARFSNIVNVEIAKRGIEGAAATEHSSYELPWEPFSFERISKLTAEQNTVLVDFTADW